MKNKHLKSQWIIVFILLPLLLWASIPLTQASPPPPAVPNIVGGEDALPGDWPWQVALVNSGAVDLYNNQFCGGSLIHPYWVLTAAHCVEGVTPAMIDIVAGIQNLATPEAGFQQRTLTTITMHPDYDPVTADNDIALLRLTEPVTLGPTAGGLEVATIALPAADVGNLTGENATITGWGNTLAQPEPGGYSFPAQLQQVEVPIVSNVACNASYNGDITDNMLCAGLYEGGKDSCQGDSGGPLAWFDTTSQSWQQAGVVSWGEGCAAPGFPGVYSRVSRFTDWIEAKMNIPTAVFHKTASSSTITPGSSITYTLTYDNIGTVLLPSQTMTDTIPAGTSYVAGSISGNGVISEGVAQWSVPPLDANGRFTATLAVRLDNQYPTSTLVVNDNLENDITHWDVAHDPNSANVDWQLVDTYPHSPIHNWFAPNLAEISDQYLLLSVPQPLGNNFALSFWHAYNLEANYDGGVVEISNDNGSTWADLGTSFIRNGYSSAIDPDWDNPLAGRSAFTGYSLKYQESQIDLAAFAGQTVQIRFRLGTDSLVSADGWYIDDVVVGSISTLNNTAYVASGQASNEVRTLVLPGPQPFFDIYLPLVRNQ